MALEGFMALERGRVEGALRGAVGALGGALGAAAGYAIGAGGKRVRPLLVVASYRAAGGESDGGVGDGEGEGGSAVYDVAAAVELVHTYSLLHDDLPCMDDDPLRRGIPTAHRVYGVPVATATGSALQTVAFLTLGRAARRDGRVAERLPEMVGRLARAAGGEGMVGGQYLDLASEGREVGAATLEAIHRGKTAALLSAACALGAMAADAEPEPLEAFADFGTNLGLAFQIVDDLLDVVGDPDRTGKAAGADAARGKATYPSVHGIDGARDQAELAAGLAREALERAGPDADPEGVALLHELVDFVVERLH